MAASRLDFLRLSDKTARPGAGDGREHNLAAHSERSWADEGSASVRRICLVPFLEGQIA